MMLSAPKNTPENARFHTWCHDRSLRNSQLIDVFLGDRTDTAAAAMNDLMRVVAVLVVVVAMKAQIDVRQMDAMRLINYTYLSRSNDQNH